MQKHLLTLAAAAALAGSLPGQAMANDRDLRATTVPAASCEVDGTAALWLNNREIAVRGSLAPLPPGAEGPASPETIDLHHRCPLPLNNVDLGGTTNDNDMTSFTVIYRDADGAAAGSLVEVTLYQNILASGTVQTTAVCSWNSNTRGTGSTGYASASMPCALDLAATAFYHFDVRLFTNRPPSPEIEASFVGIRFP